MNPVLEKGLDADAVRAFLSRGKGMNIDTFDEDSALTFEHLYEGYRKREVTLMLHETTGMAAILRRRAQSLIRAEGFVLIETQRRFENGKIVPMSGEFSTRETCFMGEPEVKATKRGCREELDLVLDEDQFKPLIERLRMPPIRRSDVYANMLSLSSIMHFEVHLDERPWKEEVRNHFDTDTMITTQWIPDVFASPKA